mgnify:CR=1 FL=1|tara:strand:- start:14165 stop:16033 length:1869 start_codon:yes stop_codon:yes gene_type:complete
MSVLKKLTEGIAQRSLQREGAALLEKWERTGLLEGLEDDSSRQGMARLLENQAAQLLKEASSMAAGDVEGFASVAFPIVRRVFGGLLANDLVSVQPMSLPSGLIFFLDFQYSDQTAARLGIDQSDSLYGGGVVGSQLTGGVSDITEEGGGFYDLSNAYSHVTGALALAADSSARTTFATIATAPAFSSTHTSFTAFAGSEVQVQNLTEAQKNAIRHDPDVLGGTATDEICEVVVHVTAAEAAKMNFRNMGAFNLTEADGTPVPGTGAKILRRLTHLGTKASNGVTLENLYHGKNNCGITFYVQGSALTAGDIDAAALLLTYPMIDAFTTADALGAIKGTDNWGLEEAGATAGVDTNRASAAAKDEIPEIDIKVDSIAVTAMTKKLKAKWTPELGQDLNAYHNLDAEVELTQILSEQIALEIDREIVKDLIEGATASTFYWSRSPGLFVSRNTGSELGAAAAAPDFTGTVSEWYETLVETINDVSAQIHRKTLRGGANFLVTSPEVANILEFTAGFRASITHDSDKGSVGAVNVGSLSKKWDVYVDPYFPRNLVLVGRRGGSFLESGYVYAPYVPLQVTPTIFGTEDFVPRKGVMTRYAKKMVRPDMYGLVVVRGLLGEEGSS